MDLYQKTKQFCSQYNIKPVRSKGQNFLINENIYDEIIKIADLKKDDVVLEVGPGLGFLTEKLARNVKKVIAVELDCKLAKILNIRMVENEIRNVKIINEDILEIQNSNFQIKNKFKIVANLPYNITSIFLRKFLSAEIKPNLMILMLQKEVAERICAKVGKMSLLAVSVQFYAEPKIIQIVPSNCFYPEPAINSAIIKITGILRYNIKNEKKFFRLVKIGFSAKRKMLKNNLASGYIISQKEAEYKLVKAGFDRKIRAQELSVDDWVKLFKKF